MVAAIETTEGAYGTSRLIVVSFAVGSILLALALGYIISWSLIEPVKKIEARLSQIAAGDFAQRIVVDNRDELGALAGNVNQTSEQLGRLYQEIETRNLELTEALEQQMATSAILRAIAASPTDIQPVLNAVAESAAKLCDAYNALILLQDGEYLVHRAHHGPIPDDMLKWPIGRDWVSGRAFVDKQPVHVDDLSTAGDDFPAGREMAIRLGHQTTLATPLLRDDEAIGVLVIRRLENRPFNRKQIDLLTTFADQAVIAIENVRLYQEVQARTAELARSVGELEALGEVSKAVNSTLNIDAVLKTIVAKAVQLSGTDAGTIYVFSSTTQQFRLRATFGMSDELIAAMSDPDHRSE